MFSSTEALRRSLNHVLGQHAWARTLLVAQAGKTLRIDSGLPVLPFLGKPPEAFYQISDAGDFSQASGANEAPASVTIRLSGLAQHVLANGPQALQRAVRVEGDAELAVCLGKIAQHLKWDPAEDLSKLTGDTLAQVLMDGLRHWAVRLQSEGSQGVQSMRNHLVAGDQPMLVGRAEFQAHADALRSTVARLQSLEGRLPLV